MKNIIHLPLNSIKKLTKNSKARGNSYDRTNNTCIYTLSNLQTQTVVGGEKDDEVSGTIHHLGSESYESGDKIPEEGACVLVCNHVSFVDALLIGGACRRPVRFVTFKPIYNMPVLNFIFRTAKAIPIDSKKADPAGYERAFERIAEELREGEVVCIFPEGKLTTDGEIDEFKNGISRILQETPVPVVPMALRGLWGSFFSHKDRPALTRLPQRFWSKIDMVVGDAILPEDATPETLKAEVALLRGDRK